MRKCITILILTLSLVSFHSFTKPGKLREIYSRDPSQWPKPNVDKDVNWQELGPLPPPPFLPRTKAETHLVQLGKTLFFDPRLSGSGKISCGSCHQPELSWTDGRDKSLGHAGQVSKRNSPSLQNVWFYKKLFWDGRSHSLEDQVFAPINSESEMHNDMAQLPRNLRKVEGYTPLFDSAFGDASIDPDRIAKAIAAFEMTITSRPSRFDQFLSGMSSALSDSEIKGLHLFRTKARCINCHNGPVFSDNSFHNNGQAGIDPGLYQVTHQEEDRGKFKTPSLRNVMRTGPWMHDGKHSEMWKLIMAYSSPSGSAGQDKLLRKLRLSARERLDLLAFLNAISPEPLEFQKPTLPE
ncbi:MAG: cytochrome-c peroxidase [Chitinophagaceae bacterium]|nr:cytochrome-c peroxidase [Chitinophagaceae bacterium]